MMGSSCFDADSWLRNVLKVVLPTMEVVTSGTAGLVQWTSITYFTYRVVVAP